jgi:hypothetical protein
MVHPDGKSFAQLNVSVLTGLRVLELGATRQASKYLSGLILPLASGISTLAQSRLFQVIVISWMMKPPCGPAFAERFHLITKFMTPQLPAVGPVTMVGLSCGTLGAGVVGVVGVGAGDVGAGAGAGAVFLKMIARRFWVRSVAEKSVVSP